MEGLRRAAIPKARSRQSGGKGSPTQAVVNAQEGPLGATVWGHGEYCPGGGRCSRRACGGQQPPRLGHTGRGGRGVLPLWWAVLKEGLWVAAVTKARAHQPQGTGSHAKAAVGAQGGPTGGSSPQGPGTPASGEVESCPGGGRCLRRAFGGSSPRGRGHTSPRGRGRLPLWWSVLKEGLRVAAVPKAGA